MGVNECSIMSVNYRSNETLSYGPAASPVSIPTPTPTWLALAMNKGSSAPIPCPPGTSSATFGMASEAGCPECEPGFYCPDNGAYNSTVECLEGFYCPGGDASPTRSGSVTI